MPTPVVAVTHAKMNRRISNKEPWKAEVKRRGDVFAFDIWSYLFGILLFAVSLPRVFRGETPRERISPLTAAARPHYHLQKEQTRLMFMA
jgi:hypothetical protein